MQPSQIKALRKSLCLSQTELAQKLEVSTAAVASWELGQRNPKPKVLAALHALSEPVATPAEVMLLCKQMLAKAYNCNAANVKIIIEL